MSNTAKRVGENGVSFDIYSPFHLRQGDILVSVEDEKVAYYVETTVDHIHPRYTCKIYRDTEENSKFHEHVTHTTTWEEDTNIFNGTKVVAKYFIPITLMEST